MLLLVVGYCHEINFLFGYEVNFVTVTFEFITKIKVTRTKADIILKIEVLNNKQWTELFLGAPCGASTALRRIAKSLQTME